MGVRVSSRRKKSKALDIGEHGNEAYPNFQIAGEK